MGHFKKIVLQNWYLFILAFAAALIASLLEGLGISYIFPIIESGQISNGVIIPFPFDHLTALFVDFNLLERLRIVAGLLVITIVLKSIFLYTNAVISAKINLSVAGYFRVICFEQLMKIGFGYLNSKKAGELQTIFGKYNQAVGQAITLIARSVPEFFNLLIYVVMALLVSWQMTIIAGVLALLGSLILKKAMTKAKKAGSDLARRNSRFDGIMFELITAVKNIRLFARERDMTSFFQKEVNDYISDSYYVVKINKSVQPIFESIATLSLASILVISSFLLLESELIAKLAVFLVVFQRITKVVSSLNQVRVNIHSLMPTIFEVLEFLKTENKQIITQGDMPFKALARSIQFKDVYFRYPTDNSYVLKNINFTIEKDSNVGIVGSSGAGKSSLTELLLGFYEPEKGCILIDGVELAKINMSDFRTKIGFVSQDTFLFNGTIRDNILFGKPTASDMELEEAAKRAFAYDFIKKLPNGFDSIVGDRGVLLSGGQKQRIAIARAILMDPEILIFDEATSALDSESERIVQTALNEVSQGKTTLTIAHRLSTISNSDKIIVLESGTIVEVGSHNVLMNKDGIYSKLVSLQQLK